jgi:DnaJ-class molecular chaperone
MTYSDGPLQRSSHANSCRCQQCGGSGMLRLDDQRYRTCLDCLGQGKVLQAMAATTVAAILQGRAGLQVSLSASSSAR